MSQPRVLCLLFPGFEEIETVAPVDLLRRAGVEVTIASLTGDRHVTGRCQMTLQADTSLQEVSDKDFDLFLVPGGPGVELVRKDGRAALWVREFIQRGKPVAAICAAPTVLHDAEVLSGKKFTSHAGVIDQLPHSRLDQAVVEDGLLITSQGAGTAIAFGLALVHRLCGEARANEVRKAIML